MFWYFRSWLVLWKSSDREWSQRTSNLIVAWSGRTSLRKWPLREGLQKPCEMPPPYFSTLPCCSAAAAMLNSSLCLHVPAFALTVLSAWRTKHRAKCEKHPDVGKTIKKKNLLLEMRDRTIACCWCKQKRLREEFSFKNAFQIYPTCWLVFYLPTSWIPSNLPFRPLGSSRVWESDSPGFEFQLHHFACATLANWTSLSLGFLIYKTRQ